MSDFSVTYRETGTADTNRLPSPDLWGDCPYLDILRGEKSGSVVEDNFDSLPLAGTQTTQIGFGERYKVFASSGDAVTCTGSVNSVATPGGILKGTLGTSADALSLAMAYPSFLLSGSSSNTQKLWFECRLAVSNVGGSHFGFFVGLAETNLFTLSATVPFNNSQTALSNAGSLIGFNLASSATQVKAVYNDRATSFTNIATGLQTMTANTFIKLGFKYDPLAASKGAGVATAGSACITLFVDNVAQTTYLTGTTLAATTNLSANPLGLLLACIADASVSSDVVYMDWWRCVQLLP